MNNKVLLVHLAMGPTFRNRLLYNIVNNLENYLLFDNLIFTDDKSHFEELSKYSNIKRENINDTRKDYLWSIEHEPLPIKTNNEEEYAKFIANIDFKIPSGLFRFVTNFFEYKAIFFLNCDIVVKFNKDTYQSFYNSLDQFNTDTVIGQNYFFYDSFQKELDFLSEAYEDLNFKHSKLESNDGNLFGYIFKNKNKQKEFLDLYNKITYAVLIEHPDKLSRLGTHGTWGLNSEVIQSIIHNLLDIQVLPSNHYLTEGFSVETYPEDRFWNWAQGGFKCNTISKDLFIKENYNLLKEFYKNRGQKWIYN